MKPMIITDERNGDTTRRKPLRMRVRSSNSGRLLSILQGRRQNSARLLTSKCVSPASSRLEVTHVTSFNDLGVSDPFASAGRLRQQQYFHDIEHTGSDSDQHHANDAASRRYRRLDGQRRVDRQWRQRRDKWFGRKRWRDNGRRKSGSTEDLHRGDCADRGLPKRRGRSSKSEYRRQSVFFDDGWRH